jgi:hypothetical protein
MSKNTSLYCFGDSWGYGAELNFNIDEKPFAKLLANEFSYDLKNFSQNNMSLGLITRTISKVADQISNTDIVLVVIPPDSRWYTEWETIDYIESANFYIDKTDDWFSYHHQLFIFTICEMLKKTGCKYLLMHNYGEFPLHNSEYYFSKFYQDKFLSQNSLTDILTGSSNCKIGPIEVEKLQDGYLFYGPYFEGNRWHPNQKGHEKIAELIKLKL